MVYIIMPFCSHFNKCEFIICLICLYDRNDPAVGRPLLQDDGGYEVVVARLVGRGPPQVLRVQSKIFIRIQGFKNIVFYFFPCVEQTESLGLKKLYQRSANFR